MSYIRSGNNPESLYIWGDGENATISEGIKPTWNIPLNIFNKTIIKFDKKFHQCPVEFKGCKVEEVWVDKNNVETLFPISQLECKIKLSYDEHYVIMWDVTWEYIVNEYIIKLNKKWKPKKKD